MTRNFTSCVLGVGAHSVRPVPSGPNALGVPGPQCPQRLECLQCTLYILLPPALRTLKLHSGRAWPSACASGQSLSRRTSLAVTLAIKRRENLALIAKEAAGNSLNRHNAKKCQSTHRNENNRTKPHVHDCFSHAPIIIRRQNDKNRHKHCDKRCPFAQEALGNTKVRQLAENSSATLSKREKTQGQLGNTQETQGHARRRTKCLAHACFRMRH